MYEVNPPDLGTSACDLVRSRWCLSFDTETYRMPMVEYAERGRSKSYTRNRVSRLVCSSWHGRDEVPDVLAAECSAGRGIIEQGVRGWRALLDREGTKAVARWAFDPANGVVFVGHNLVFDVTVLMHALRRDSTFSANVFTAYAQDRICDTQIREKLLAISGGWLDVDPQSGKPTSFSLAACAQRRLGITVEGKEGEDAWRLRYHELDGMPMSDWPTAARDYALSDAEYPLLVALSQAPVGSPVLSEQLDPVTTSVGGVIDEGRQCRASLALYLQSAWGVRTDPNTVALWEQEIEEALEEATAGLRRVGILRSNGVKDTKHMRKLIEDDFVRQGKVPPMTEPSSRYPEGQIKTDAETLAQCKTDELRAWGEAAHYEKWRTTYLQPAILGTTGILPYNYNPLVASGRTSSFGTNAQNPPRKGRFRECVVARPGMVLCSVDYTAAELAGLAQIHYWLFGQSALRDTINAGIDAHAPVAAQLAGVSTPTMIKWLQEGNPKFKQAKGLYRQAAKVANFGIPGGLGARTLVTYAAGMGVNLYEISAELDPSVRTESLNERETVAYNYAQHIIDTWSKAVPEGPRYMALINDALSYSPSFTFMQFGSGRQRGGCGYCDGCNTGFQGIVADGAKEAIWRLSVACYLPPKQAIAILTAPDVYWHTMKPKEIEDACKHLYGVRPVLFIHDEEIAEGPEATAHLWAPAMAAIMREGMRTYIRDVVVEAEPALMRRWYKEAAARYDQDGRLVPWEPNT
jgi:hypothetical protein